MSGGAPEGILVTPQSWVFHSMHPFLPRIIHPSLYFPQSISYLILCIHISCHCSYIRNEKKPIKLTPVHWAVCVALPAAHELFMVACSAVGVLQPCCNWPCSGGLTAPSPGAAGSNSHRSLLLQWLHFHRQPYPLEIPWSPTSATLFLSFFIPCTWGGRQDHCGFCSWSRNEGKKKFRRLKM